jgi:hypothetical protein
MKKADNKYFAFISYNSKDIAWGRKLQRKLEHYRMPATLCSEKGWERTPIRPVFFAPTDIQPGGLTKELQDRLHASRNLVVICSPNSAKSEWVGREIAFFMNWDGQEIFISSLLMEFRIAVTLRPSALIRLLTSLDYRKS